jgi:general secretion pathway protein G
MSVQSRDNARRGLTLVELMVVVVILGLLATAVVVNVTGHLSRGKRQRVLTDLATLRDAVEYYYGEFGKYPDSNEGLKALLTRTDNFPNGLVSQIPVDPWAKPYVYQYPAEGRAYNILCLGRDGRQGGEGEDADLDLNDLQGQKQEQT